MLHMLLAAIELTTALMGTPIAGILPLNLARSMVSWGCLIAVMAWQHRAYTTLGAFFIGGLRSTPLSVIIFWFIPFVNFFKPWQAVTEIWQASDPRVPIDPARPLSWKRVPTSPLVTLWWLSYFSPFLMVFLVVQNLNFVATAAFFEWTGATM